MDSAGSSRTVLLVLERKAIEKASCKGEGEGKWRKELVACLSAEISQATTWLTNSNMVEIGAESIREWMRGAEGQERVLRLWLETEERESSVFLRKAGQLCNAALWKICKQLHGVFGKSKHIISLEDNYSSPLLGLSSGESAFLGERGGACLLGLWLTVSAGLILKRRGNNI